MERVETFVFRFNDKAVWQKFFTEYFTTSALDITGMEGVSCEVGNVIRQHEEFQEMVYNFFEAFNIGIDMLVAKTPKQQELLEKMQKFIND